MSGRSGRGPRNLVHAATPFLDPRDYLSRALLDAFDALEIGSPYLAEAALERAVMDYPAGAYGSAMVQKVGAWLVDGARCGSRVLRQRAREHRLYDGT